MTETLPLSKSLSCAKLSPRVRENAHWTLLPLTPRLTARDGAISKRISSQWAPKGNKTLINHFPDHKKTGKSTSDVPRVSSLQGKSSTEGKEVQLSNLSKLNILTNVLLCVIVLKYSSLLTENTYTFKGHYPVPKGVVATPPLGSRDDAQRAPSRQSHPD